MAITDRLNAAWKAFNNTNAAKSAYYPTTGYNWVFGGLSKEARRYDSSRWSIAMAYLLLEPVRKSIDTYAYIITRIPYKIVQNPGYDPKDDIEIASSTDVNDSRSPVLALFRNHRRLYHISFMQAIMYEQMLYDMILTELIPSAYTAARIPQERKIGGLRVLRGAAVQVEADYSNGTIRQFYYNGDGQAVRFDPDEVAYDKGYNPLSDYEGSSITESVLSELNILEAFQRYLQRYLKKADRPDVYASFENGDNSNTQNVQALKNELERYRQNPDNTIFIGSLPLSFNAIPAADLNNQLGIDEPTRKAIYRAFGVPLAMAGDTSFTNYKEGDEVYAAFVKNEVMPRLANIQQYVNDNIFPALGLDETYRLEFDVSEFEIVTERDQIRSNVIGQDLRSGLISIGKAQEERGYDVDETFNELYMLPDGTPVPKTELFNLWRYKYQAPAQLDKANAQQAQADAATTLADARQPNAEPAPNVPSEETALAAIAPGAKETVKALPNQRPAYAYIPLANDPEIIKVIRSLKEVLTDKRIEWQTAPTYHVTVCYADMISDSAIHDEIGRDIRMSNFEVSPSKSDSLAYFDTPDGKALHIAIEHSEPLDALQANVYQTFTDYGDGVSEHSNPDGYNPHITLAYIPDDIELNMETLRGIVDLTNKVWKVDSVVIARDDYEPTLTIRAHQHIKRVQTWDYTRDKALDELKKWQAHIKANKSRAFEPYYLRGNIADMLEHNLHAGVSAQKAFDAAFELYREHDIKSLETAFERVLRALVANDIKAIGAVETDFKVRFNAVVEEMRQGNLDDRRRAGTILRSILRTFSIRAYEEGLRDGGVFDPPNEDELKEVEAHVKEQSQYVSGLTETIIKLDGITDAQFAQKAGQWFGKSIKPMYTAGLASANANQMMEFVGDDGLESCGTCTRLKGQRHRLKDWVRKELVPQENTDNYICGGFECQHFLESVQAKARGSW